MARRYRGVLLLLALAALIKIFSLFPVAVERYYSNGLYPGIAVVQRILFGWVPISVGDLLYGATGIWLIAQLVLIVRKIRSKTASGTYFLSVGRRLLTGMLVVYVLFN